MNKSNLLIILMITMVLIMISIMFFPPQNYKFHPLNLMLILISLTSMMTLNMNFIFKSWMPMILFLVIIGGLMIIFLYITSLSNNEIFLIKWDYIKKLMFKYMSLFLLCVILMFFFINMTLNWNSNELWSMNFIYLNINNFTFINMIFLKYMTILFSMNYLFYSMICIMNICYKFNLPLRQLFNYE